jgi:hypothetical protein
MCWSFCDDSTLIPSRDDRLRIRLSARMVLRTNCICLCVCSCVARRMFRRACMARRICVRVWSPCRSAESPPSPVSSEVMVCAQSACVVGVYRVSLCSDGSKATMKCASPNPAAQVAATTKRTTPPRQSMSMWRRYYTSSSELTLGVNSGSCTQVRCSPGRMLVPAGLAIPLMASIPRACPLAQPAAAVVRGHRLAACWWRRRSALKEVL